MDKIFVDTNIILDWLGQRAPYFEFAKALFRLGEEKKIEIFISTMSFISTEYILRKQIGKERTKQTLSALRTFCKVTQSGSGEIDLALVSTFNDFEDAFQYYNALNNACNVIITRDPKGFKSAELPVMTAEEYLKSF